MDIEQHMKEYEGAPHPVAEFFNKDKTICPHCKTERPTRLMLTELHPKAGCRECYNGGMDVLDIMPKMYIIWEMEKEIPELIKNTNDERETDYDWYVEDCAEYGITPKTLDEVIKLSH